MKKYFRDMSCHNPKAKHGDCFQVLRMGVIAKHLNEFDGSFLAAVSAYVQVAESSGDFGLLSLLAAIREEVISAVSGEMQPDIQVVQLLQRWSWCARGYRFSGLAYCSGTIY